MDTNRFAELLDAYGADPRRWPAAERAAALALAQASTEARRLLEEATSVDALLAAPPGITPSSDLAARIMAQLPAEPASMSQSFSLRLTGLLREMSPFRILWPQMATLALALSIGIGVGLGDYMEGFVAAEDSASLAVEQVVADASYMMEYVQ